MAVQREKNRNTKREATNGGYVVTPDKLRVRDKVQFRPPNFFFLGSRQPQLAAPPCDGEEGRVGRLAVQGGQHEEGGRLSGVVREEEGCEGEAEQRPGPLGPLLCPGTAVT